MREVAKIVTHNGHTHEAAILQNQCILEQIRLSSIISAMFQTMFHVAKIVRKFFLIITTRD